MVLRVTTGSINRGACIRWLSQYPSEVEYLWVPCSYLEPSGAILLELAGSGGVVSVVPVCA